MKNLFRNSCGNIFIEGARMTLNLKTKNLLSGSFYLYICPDFLYDFPNNIYIFLITHWQSKIGNYIL